MKTATLNISVLSKRMLTKSEAAHHCGRPVKRFNIECPVTPIRFDNGDIRFDVHDLDKWLDTLKPGDHSAEVEAIVERL